MGCTGPASTGSSLRRAFLTPCLPSISAPCTPSNSFDLCCVLWCAPAAGIPLQLPPALLGPQVCGASSDLCFVCVSSAAGIGSSSPLLFLARKYAVLDGPGFPIVVCAHCVRHTWLPVLVTTATVLHFLSVLDGPGFPIVVRWLRQHFARYYTDATLATVLCYVASCPLRFVGNAWGQTGPGDAVPCIMHPEQGEQYGFYLFVLPFSSPTYLFSSFHLRRGGHEEPNDTCVEQLMNINRCCCPIC